MNEKGFIYKITNVITQSVYVGQTLDFKKRKYRYSVLDCKNQRLLFCSIKRYGWVNHSFEIIEECFISDLNDKEVYYITLFKSWSTDYPNTGLNILLYNKTRKGISHSQQTKAKLSQLNKGKKLSDLTKRKMSASRMGIGSRIKSVYQFTLNGSLINKYNSISEAKRKTKIINIYDCIIGKYKQSGGFVWSDTNVFKKPTPVSTSTPQHIVNNIIQKWESGLNQKEVSIIFNISHSLVNKIIKKHNDNKPDNERSPRKFCSKRIL